MFVLDSHIDTPSQIYRGRDIVRNNPDGHVDFPKLVKGKVDGAFFALYVPNTMPQEESEKYAEELLKVVYDMLEANKDKAELALSPDQAMENKSKGLFSVLIGLENGQPIGKSLDRLRWFYDKGVRYITLTHAGDNEICDSCATRIKKWGGLSPFGREVIAEMNRLGMMIDVSHISDASFYDVLDHSVAPVVATHSCCRALAGHPRNMTDDMIKALAAAGGVIQVNFYPVFLDDSCTDEISISYKRIVDHIDHIVSLVGIDYVGLGSDFDGIDIAPEGLEDISYYPRIFEEMRLRGYSEQDISKVASGNFFRVFQQVINIANN